MMFAYYIVIFGAVIVFTALNGRLTCAALFSVMLSRELVITLVDRHYRFIRARDAKYIGRLEKTVYIVCQSLVEYSQFGIILIFALQTGEIDDVVEIVLQSFILMVTFYKFFSGINSKLAYETPDRSNLPKTFKGKIKVKVRELDVYRMALTAGLLINMIYNSWGEVEIYSALVLFSFLIFYSLTKFAGVVNPREMHPWRFSAPVWITLLAGVNLLKFLGAL